MSAAQALDNVTQFPAVEVPRKGDDNGIPSAIPASLFIKLFKIMEEMDGVPRSGKHKQGWAFMQADDVFNGARKAFLRHRVLVIPGVLPSSVLQVEGAVSERGNASLRSLVVFTYTFVDVDSGQSYTTTWPGESQDYSDKGVQQAGTSSMKYMLMKMFLATPDHDPDYNSDDEPKQKKAAKEATPEATKSGQSVQNSAARPVPTHHAPATGTAATVDEIPSDLFQTLMKDKEISKASKTYEERAATIRKLWAEGKITAEQDEFDRVIAVIERLQSHRKEGAK